MELVVHCMLRISKGLNSSTTQMPIYECLWAVNYAWSFLHLILITPKVLKQSRILTVMHVMHSPTGCVQKTIDLGRSLVWSCVDLVEWLRNEMERVTTNSEKLSWLCPTKICALLIYVLLLDGELILRTFLTAVSLQMCLVHRKKKQLSSYGSYDERHIFQTNLRRICQNMCDGSSLAVCKASAWMKLNAHLSHWHLRYGLLWSFGLNFDVMDCFACEKPWR